MEEEAKRTGYISYAGMARTPMVFGIPYMALMIILSPSMLLGMVAGVKYGPIGWSVGLVCVPILLFIKSISETDDKAFHILMLEVKWFLRKRFLGNTGYYGGAMMIAPVTYKRKYNDVKRFIETTTSGRRLPSAVQLPRN